MKRYKSAAKTYTILAVLAGMTVAAPLQAMAKQAQPAASQPIKVAALTKHTEKVVEEARKMLPYLSQFPHQSIEPGEDGRFVIQLQQAKDVEYPRISLFVDGSTGEWTGFRRNNGGTTPFSTYPLNQAKEKAAAFMKTWYGNDMGGYQFNPSMTTSADTIVFSRVVNGIPFQNDSTSILVDNSGEVIGKTGGLSKGRPQDNYVFPKPEDALSKEQVAKELSRYLQLQYELKEDGPLLRYAFAFSGELDALTGQDAAGGEYRQIIKVQPKGQTPLIRNAAEAASFLAKQGIKTEGASLKEESLAKANRKNYEWWKDEDLIAIIGVNTTDNRLLNFEEYPRMQEGKSSERKITPEQVPALAIKELETYLPQNEKEIILLETPRYEKNGNSYQAEFALVREGIPVREWRNVIVVNAESGKIIKVSLSNPEPKSFPQANQAIKPEQAAASYVEQFPLTLVYELKNATDKEAKLVYKGIDTIRGQRIDAVTGKILDWKE
ncbi:hypothetical protein NDK47_22760 [Brevibacillus ruminantium]|uniref:YcdB/YcdC repeated domain-containing protein n=1 Tax=Brevibacillus ruminantium TaxID=2950604 RepID=A0ABY4WDE0_9BACL|nr:YcdB/YcdC domain-containing protein [Brevibacillus ruminantium]USG64914.1 hypothetical protein NDK47_22760 [Brevibacillus ruminantium]